MQREYIAMAGLKEAPKTLKITMLVHMINSIILLLAIGFLEITVDSPNNGHLGT